MRENRALIADAPSAPPCRSFCAVFTLDQSRRLLEGSPVPDADPEDAKELLNYRKAFEFVSEYLSGVGPITEGLIREIHRRLVESVRGGGAGPGEYRKIQNYVVNSLTGEIIYEPPPAYDVPIMMAELVDWLHREQEIHPVLVSGRRSNESDGPRQTIRVQ